MDKVFVFNPVSNLFTGLGVPPLVLTVGQDPTLHVPVHLDGVGRVDDPLSSEYLTQIL